MFDNAIALNPTAFGGANASKVFDLINVSANKGTASIRRVSATASTTPETMTISHQVEKQGAVAVDAHLVRFDTLFMDPVKGQVKLSCWLSIKVPQGTSVVTEQLIKDQVGRLLAFEQTAGALLKILNGEP